MREKLPQLSQPHQAYSFDRFTLDLDREALYDGHAEIRLRPKTFSVLKILVSSHGTLVGKDELLQTVWGGTVAAEGSLTQCLVEIRRALGDQGRTMIRTVPKRGFIMDVPVEIDSADVPRSAKTIHTPHPGSVAGQRKTRRYALAALAVVVCLVLVWRWSISPLEEAERGPGEAATEAGPANSIAVLPFVDMTENGVDSYIGDGIADEIINRLAQSESLRVTARTSSFSFRGRPELDIREIAATLGVAHVLEGSVRKDGKLLRIRAQLIDGESGAHLWSKTFDSSGTRIIAAQDEIAVAVAGALQVTLSDLAVNPEARIIDPSAYELYLHGIFLYHRGSDGDMVTARDYFDMAVTAAPDFWPAWEALAGAYAILYFDGSKISPEVAEESMRNAIEQALRLAPNSADVQVRAARYHRYFGDEMLMREHLARAYELGPHSLLVLAEKAQAHGSRGEFHEALVFQREAVAINPVSALYRGNLAVLLLAAGLYAEALSEARRALELNPSDELLAIYEVEALVLLGRFSEALELASHLPDEDRRQLYRAMALYGLSRDREALVEADPLLADSSPRTAALRAMLYTFMGDHDAALNALERTGADTVPDLRKLVYSPFLRPLHQEPRWQSLLAQR